MSFDFAWISPKTTLFQTKKIKVLYTPHLLMNHSHQLLHENHHLHFDLLDQDHQLHHSRHLHCLGFHHPDIIIIQISKYHLFCMLGYLANELLEGKTKKTSKIYQCEKGVPIGKHKTK